MHQVPHGLCCYVPAYPPGFPSTAPCSTPVPDLLGFVLLLA